MNIQAVARRTGVPAATLRKWEERYGVPQPSRTDGAQRRYSDRDVRQIEWLRDRLAEGLRIGQAVALLARVAEPVGTPAQLRAAIVEASRARSAGRIEALVNQAFAAHPPEVAISQIVEPALVEAGELWERGEITVADEHLLSQLTATKLRAVRDAAPGGGRGTAVLACIPDERHEVGLLAVAVLLESDGWRVLYLGQDTPLDQAFELADESGARLLALSATMPASARRAERALAGLEEEFPRIRVVRGGAGFGGEPAAEVVRSLRRLRRPDAVSTSA